MLSTKQRNNQWITASIEVSCRLKNSLYILSKNTNSPLIKALYTQNSKILRKLIRTAKHLYYNELIKTSGNTKHYGRQYIREF